MTEDIQQIIAALVTILSILIAWWQNRQKNDIVEFYSEPAQASSPVTSIVPVKSWTMSEETRRWITFGESDQDKIEILKQVDLNEHLGNVSYTIHYSKGFYLIEYGLIKSSGREK